MIDMRNILKISENGHRNARRGSMLVMVAVLMVVVMAMVAFTVDVAYMQLVRTELRVANDAAAKAGALALAKSKGDANVARDAAIAAAARNRVAGVPMVLKAEDIEVGHSEKQQDGTWRFNVNQVPFTALRINGGRTSQSTDGAVKLFFGNFVATTEFQPANTSVASQLEQEVCLVVDRSHSMCFDMSGVDWSYPPGTKKFPHPICYPPHPTLSRWGALESSIKQFVQTIKTAKVAPRVSLVTWGSDIGTNTAEYQLTGRTEIAKCKEKDLTVDYDTIKSFINGRTNRVMLGGTNMSAGIDEGIEVLTSIHVSPLAQRTMILMSDGQWNQGRDPILAAHEAAAQNIVIHTISFLSNGNASTLQQIATITGGKFYASDNKEELEAAFVNIAVSLPIVLTE
jgi:Ca-activated chloride channel homolog